MPVTRRIEPIVADFTVTTVRVPAGLGLPGEFLCLRCRGFAMAWVEDAEAAARPGCATWVCFTCNRILEAVVDA